jgi:hypothetical protein
MWLEGAESKAGSLRTVLELRVHGGESAGSVGGFPQGGGAVQGV